MLSNYAFGEDSWKSLGLQGDQISHKGNQSWIFIGSTDAEVETPKLWPPDLKNWLLRKDPDGGKDWRQDEKGTTEDEMAGWHHQLDGHEFEQALGVGVGQGNLACCSPWDHKESDTTELLNWTELSLCCTLEINTPVYINYISVTFKKKESLGSISYCWWCGW